MKHLSIAAAAGLLALAGCGGNEASETLEEAAEQSTPAAAEVLENRADALEDADYNGSLSAPGSPVQDAMQDAGNASAPSEPQESVPPGANAPTEQ